MVGRQQVQILVSPQDLEESSLEMERSNWQVMNFDITVNSSGLVLGTASSRVR